MALIPESHLFTIIIRNSGLCHSGSADVTNNVLGDFGSGVEIGGRSMDIEAVIIIVIQTIYQIGKFNRRITGKVNRRFQIYQKCCHPAFAKHGVREMMKGFVNALKHRFYPLEESCRDLYWIELIYM